MLEAEEPISDIHSHHILQEASEKNFYYSYQFWSIDLR